MELPEEGVTHNFALSRTQYPTSAAASLRRSHSSFLSLSWIPLRVTPHTFLHSSHFWSPLIRFVQTSPVLDYQSAGCCLIDATCSLGNTHTALSFCFPSPLFLSNSAANSRRSCHRALRSVNLNPFLFYSILEQALKADRLSPQLLLISSLPAWCAGCGSWGGFHTATNTTRWGESVLVEHQLLHIFVGKHVVEMKGKRRNSRERSACCFKVSVQSGLQL